MKKYFLESENIIMTAMRTNKRLASRKDVATLNVASLTSLDNLAKLAKNLIVIQASSSGILLKVDRKNLVPATLKRNLTLDSLIGNRVFIKLEEMNLEICGTITRTKLLGKEGFHIAIDYSDDAPEYWRECLIDLMPAPGELD